MKILYLPLNKERYEMIERGEQLEDYRRFSAYWISRLTEWCCVGDVPVMRIPFVKDLVRERITKDEARDIETGKRTTKWINGSKASVCMKIYDAVCFYDSTKRRMTFECKGIAFGQGRYDCGATDDEDENVFIIQLGARL